MMLSLTRPEFFVPVHGEYRHLKAHARLAEALGVEAANVVIAEDGDVVVLDDDGIHLAEDRAPGGYVYVDGSGVGDINAGVLRDRQVLSDDGVLIAVVGVDSRDGAIVRGPRSCRGLPRARRAGAVREGGRRRRPPVDRVRRSGGRPRPHDAVTPRAPVPEPLRQQAHTPPSARVPARHRAVAAATAAHRGTGRWT